LEVFRFVQTNCQRHFDSSARRCISVCRSEVERKGVEDAREKQHCVANSKRRSFNTKKKEERKKIHTDFCPFRNSVVVHPKC
jgi:hypothetical protein